MSNRVEKLPKWAQDRIRNLEMQVAELRVNWTTQWGEYKPLDAPHIEIGYGDLVGKPKRLLPPEERVCFYVGGGLREAFETRLILKDRTLSIQAGCAISLQPRASNAVLVQLGQ